ncbi:MAG: cysteine--tRNA ligase, partial [Armatimonadetes bacterium 13_1_40CM_3_65_7]
MGLRVYNTLTRRVDEFVPLKPGQVRMYVCGPNLYGPSHVGHALSYLVFDVIRRYLEHRGYQVKHVQNFTDIEDRIIETARSQGTTVEALAARYADRFLREMSALNIRRADHYPRATEAIPQMLDIIRALLARGFAYAVDGDVYFRVTAFPAYGRLSGRSLDEMQAGSRVEIDPRKEHPMDFVLWKAAKPGEPSWDSPWGPGRPGWHIECSAMSLADLGNHLDIHGGGQDVVFPHHENEIAQSEAYTGEPPFVRYWVHNGLLRLTEGPEKMTRHLGNIVTIEEALGRYHPDAIRVFVLSSHYRSPATWSDASLEAATRGAERLRIAAEHAEAVLRPAAARKGETARAAGLASAADAARAAFEAAMDEDFNTPRALAAVFD